jgi:hypothetical protein
MDGYIASYHYSIKLICTKVHELGKYCWSMVQKSKETKTSINRNLMAESTGVKPLALAGQHHHDMVNEGMGGFGNPPAPEALFQGAPDSLSNKWGQ